MLTKAQVWVSAILYMLIAAAALVIILEAGIPILERLKDSTTLSRTKEIMLNLDKHIETVANQGEGSQTVVNLEIKDGELKIKEDQIYWEMETKSKLVDSRSSSSVGNLLVASNANVETIELDDSYILRTEIKEDVFEVKINRTGSEDNWQPIDTTRLIDYISYNGNMMDGTFSFALNNDPTSTTGNGYTKMDPAGNNSNQGKARVTAHINSSFAEYDLEISLEGYSDYITTKIKNFRAK